jgi:undecaprenyl-diphosphatase
VIRQGRLPVAAFVGASLSLVLFLALLRAVSSGAAADLDDLIRSGIHHWASGLGLWLALGFSRLGSIAALAVLFGIAVLGFWLAERRRSAARLALFMAGAVVLENGLKYGFQRARPEAFFGSAPATYSFPSGHALLSLCFYGMAAAMLARRSKSGVARAAIWTTAALLIFGIGLSRIYLGVHYPTDVIGGYLAALFWMSLFWLFERSGPRRG